ncbi:MAG: M15 family metallopeptidase [Oscillospiraceae bacterium]|nr:M15 family metallopeptidase [Oscillospiraceae bacterium]
MAVVDDIGNITAVSEGECIIRVQSAVSPEVYAEVNVTVISPEEEESEPSSKNEGDTELTYIDGILIANKTYALPSDYNPGVDPDAQAAFDKMQSAAAEEGLNIYISSGFRSYDYQAGLYERYVERSGKAEADRYSARPGHSEHQTGLAFDLNSIDITFADTEEYEWVKAHCAEYGFIIRYPEGKESITGYMYEPWHIRYLGAETAKKVTDSGLTLEEYLGIDSKYSE